MTTEELTAAVHRAAHRQERTIVSLPNVGSAAVIPVEDLELLERLADAEMDRIDIADALAAKEEARLTGTISLEDLIRELGDQP